MTGAVVSTLARAAKAAAPVVEAIKQAVLQSPVIQSDETSARVGGRNHWPWVFLGPEAVYHRIAPGRGAAVITEALGRVVAPAGVCDCFSAQLKAPARVFQLCLQHQLRDRQRVPDQAPQESPRRGRAETVSGGHSSQASL